MTLLSKYHPPPPGKILLCLGIRIDDIFEHPGVRIGLNQGVYLDEDKDDEKDDDHGDVNIALFLKQPSSVVHRER